MTNRTVVLKSIHNAIVTDNPDSDLTTKQMRAKLRQVRKDDHVKNTSWVFTDDEADEVRAMFDPAFAEKLTKRRAGEGKLTKDECLAILERNDISLDDLEGSGKNGNVIVSDMRDYIANAELA